MGDAKPVLFVSGMPGAGKTYLAKHLTEHEFPKRQLHAEYIEMSSIVKKWIAASPNSGTSILDTEIGSGALWAHLWAAIQVCDRTPGVDLVLISGVREPGLLRSDVIDRRHMIVYLDVDIDIRRKRYESSGKWDFRLVDRRASELGTAAIAHHAVCMFRDAYDVAAASALIANLATIYLFTKEINRAASVH